MHGDPRRLWSEADFGQRRALVRLIVERGEVMPARRGERFDPSRVRIVVLATSRPLPTAETGAEWSLQGLI